MMNKLKLFNQLARMVLLLLFFAQAAAQPNDNASQTVRAFYQRVFAGKVEFSEESIRQHRRWFTAKLYREFLNAFDRESKRPDAATRVPYIDGDVFTYSQEEPTFFHLGRATMTSTEARVPVRLFWRYQGKITLKRTVVVVLQKQRDRWRIADLIYEDQQDLLTLLRKHP